MNKRSTWATEYLRLVEDCEKRESRLTEWEVNFIDSIRSQLERETSLTSKQIEVLDKIWEKATARG